MDHNLKGGAPNLLKHSNSALRSGNFQRTRERPSSGEVETQQFRLAEWKPTYTLLAAPNLPTLKHSNSALRSGNPHGPQPERWGAEPVETQQFRLAEWKLSTYS